MCDDDELVKIINQANILQMLTTPRQMTIMGNRRFRAITAEAEAIMRMTPFE